VEPLETRGRQQGRIDLTRFDRLQPSLDVPPQRYDLEVGTQAQQLSLAPRGRRADDRASFELLDRRRADEPVADVAAWTDCGDVDVPRANALDVLHRMDAEIDFTLKQGAIQLLGPQALSADLGERPV